MENIVWGIIGCGDVTEVKSGPAFGKVEGSSIGAVMRRDAAKAEDYAKRHKIKKWYADAADLINDPLINAIYIATPPSSHEKYTIAAIYAGKPVYVEKPMSISQSSCQKMAEAAEAKQVKVSIAHYRRFLPLYLKVKELIAAGAIGKISFVSLNLWQAAKPGKVNSNWRVDPTVSGGGVFHDLAPHQLDIIRFLFGPVETADGYAANQSGLNNSDDIVNGKIVFANGVLFTGLWCFNVPESSATDRCEIVGSKGSIRFAFFGAAELVVIIDGQTHRFDFVNPPHVQQPMIEQVVNYFLDKGPNPCPASEATEIAGLMDAFTGTR
ncbi:MAG: Gfo/Idh/MocA family oxidoreductase [Chitinophagaceae bacterium]